MGAWPCIALIGSGNGKAYRIDPLAVSRGRTLRITVWPPIARFWLKRSRCTPLMLRALDRCTPCAIVRRDAEVTLGEGNL
jgi:hypothetical protein